MNRHQIDEALALDAGDQALRPHRGMAELMFSPGRPKLQAQRRRGEGVDGRHERNRPNSHPEMRHARA